MWWWWIGGGIYVVGFFATFYFNSMLGMVTLPLCLLRAAVWPIYLVTGWPSGRQLPMD